MSELFRQDITKKFKEELKGMLTSETLINSIKVEFIAYVEYLTLDELYPDDTKEQIKEANDKLDRCDTVLFCAEIKVSNGYVSGVNSLGGCHYDSYQQFIDEGGYLNDMFMQAFKGFFIEFDEMLSFSTTVISESNNE